MPTFEFDDSTPNVQTSISTLPYAYNFNEDGVNFVFSVVSVTGSVNLEHFPADDGGFLYGSASGQGGDVFSLDIAGTTQNFSNVQLNITSASSAQVTLHGTGTNADVMQILNGPGTVSGMGTYSHFTFTVSTGGYVQLNDLTANITCFCANTRIATPNGDVAVQDLAPGDVISTADGGTTTVRWIGTRDIDVRMSLPAKVNPICITAGTLGNARDLLVSGDHGIEIDGLLVNASALVNGETIYQVTDMPQDGFTYYHVETDGHKLLLAEGIAAETYLATSDEWSFDNSATRPEREVAEMTMLRISSARLLPATVAKRLLPARAA